MARTAGPGQRRPAMRRDVQADGPALPQPWDVEWQVPNARGRQHGHPHGGGQSAVPGSATEAWLPGRSGTSEGKPTCRGSPFSAGYPGPATEGGWLVAHFVADGRGHHRENNGMQV